MLSVCLSAFYLSVCLSVCAATPKRYFEQQVNQPQPGRDPAEAEALVSRVASESAKSALLQDTHSSAHTHRFLSLSRRLETEQRSEMGRGRKSGNDFKEGRKEDRSKDCSYAPKARKATM
jgi:hypothetical protein